MIMINGYFIFSLVFTLYLIPASGQVYNVKMCSEETPFHSSFLTINIDEKLMIDLSTNLLGYGDFPVSCGCVIESNNTISGTESFRFSDKSALDNMDYGGEINTFYYGLDYCKNETILGGTNDTMIDAMYVKYNLWQKSRWVDGSPGSRHHIIGSIHITVSETTNISITCSEDLELLPVSPTCDDMAIDHSTSMPSDGRESNSSEVHNDTLTGSSEQSGDSSKGNELIVGVIVGSVVVFIIIIVIVGVICIVMKRKNVDKDGNPVDESSHPSALRDQYETNIDESNGKDNANLYSLASTPSQPKATLDSGNTLQSTDYLEPKAITNQIVSKTSSTNSDVIFADNELYEAALPVDATKLEAEDAYSTRIP